jgi:hypothetical protein
MPLVAAPPSTCMHACPTPHHPTPPLPPFPVPAAGTLLSVLDHCTTPFGRRRLRQWLCRPLGRIADITARQDAVADLMGPLADTCGAARKLLAGAGGRACVWAGGREPLSSVTLSHAAWGQAWGVGTRAMCPVHARWLLWEGRKGREVRHGFKLLAVCCGGVGVGIGLCAPLRNNARPLHTRNLLTLATSTATPTPSNPPPIPRRPWNAGISDLERAIARLHASTVAGASGRDAANVVLYEDAGRRKVAALLAALKDLRVGGGGEAGKGGWGWGQRGHGAGGPGRTCGKVGAMWRRGSRGGGRAYMNFCTADGASSPLLLLQPPPAHSRAGTHKLTRLPFPMSTLARGAVAPTGCPAGPRQVP